MIFRNLLNWNKYFSYIKSLAKWWRTGLLFRKGKSIRTGKAKCHMLANFTIKTQKPSFIRTVNCKFFYNTATVPFYMQNVTVAACIYFLLISSLSSSCLPLLHLSHLSLISLPLHHSLFNLQASSLHHFTTSQSLSTHLQSLPNCQWLWVIRGFGWVLGLMGSGLMGFRIGLFQVDRWL